MHQHYLPVPTDALQRQMTVIVTVIFITFAQTIHLLQLEIQMTSKFKTVSDSRV